MDRAGFAHKLPARAPFDGAQDPLRDAARRSRLLPMNRPLVGKRRERGRLGRRGGLHSIDGGRAARAPSQFIGPTDPRASADPNIRASGWVLPFNRILPLTLRRPLLSRRNLFAPCRRVLRGRLEACGLG